MKRLLLCLCLLISRHGCEDAEVVGDRDLTVIDEDDIAAGDEEEGSLAPEQETESSPCMLETVDIDDKEKYYVNCANRNISGRLL